MPQRALEERGNRTGVYVIVEGKPVFHYVNVIGGNDRDVAVSGLPPGVSVVTNPERTSLADAEASWAGNVPAYAERYKME